MDLFGMYGSRSDDEPAGTPEQPAERAPRPAPRREPEADTGPIERVPSARADAVRHFVETMDGVEFEGQIVRPYARTGGRTRSVAGLELETMLSLTIHDVPVQLPSEHRAVCELCRDPLSVAEVAAYRALPIGAARVIITDLLELGLVDLVSQTTDGAPTLDLMQRVLNGLHRL